MMVETLRLNVMRGARYVGTALPEATVAKTVETILSRMPDRPDLYAIKAGRNAGIDHLRATAAAARRMEKAQAAAIAVAQAQRDYAAAVEEIEDAIHLDLVTYSGSQKPEARAAMMDILRMTVAGETTPAMMQKYSISAALVHQRLRRARVAIVPCLSENARKVAERPPRAPRG